LFRTEELVQCQQCGAARAHEFSLIVGYAPIKPENFRAMVEAVGEIFNPQFVA
jgi:hypothetical protein